ncbi:GIY-YIG nuclease family protein [Candidatus Uhrbacteria bacterium]|nr:GIY-YIG nuclease family protein [Candidatus Uhrbacteria bacterium]
MLEKYCFQEVECPEFIEGQNQFYVYLLNCSDGSLYCGSTSNLKERINKHNSGAAAIWTKNRLPAWLVYFETYDTLLESRRREKQIKGWTTKKKMNLILGIWKKVSK